MAPTLRQDADALGRMTPEQAEAIVWRSEDADGTNVTAIIGADAPLDWDHGFHVDRVDIGPGEFIDWSDATDKEVLFVHDGRVDIECDDGVVALAEGDTISLPTGLPRRLRSDTGAVTFLVHL